MRTIELKVPRLATMLVVVILALMLSLSVSLEARAGEKAAAADTGPFGTLFQNKAPEKPKAKKPTPHKTGMLKPKKPQSTHAASCKPAKIVKDPGQIDDAGAFAFRA